MGSPATSFLPGGPAHHLTLRSPFRQVSPRSTPGPSEHPGLGRPNAGHTLPHTGLGVWVWGCPPWHPDSHLELEAGAGRDSRTTAPMALVRSPGKEQKEERAKWVLGSVTEIQNDLKNFSAVSIFRYVIRARLSTTAWGTKTNMILGQLSRL